ncbi:MAG: photosynthetic reaction center subunit H [Caulobacteraceae bacterium]
MYNAEFAGTIDLTLLIFLSFVLFFFGLIFYLRREDRREGYPLEDDVTGRLEGASGLFFTAQPKTFILPHGAGEVSKPDSGRDPVGIATAQRTARVSGSPLEPVGDPLQAGVGPGSYVERARRPDQTLHGQAKIVPLRTDPAYFIPRFDTDPRGMTVLGADRVPAGVVSDVWVDRAEYLIRYIEVELTPLLGPGLTVVGSAPARRVLVPMTMAVIRKGRGLVAVDAVLAAQFAGAPTLERPDQITFYEEERVCAYFGAGFLYATPMRAEPWL